MFALQLIKIHYAPSELKVCRPAFRYIDYMACVDYTISYIILMSCEISIKYSRYNILADILYRKRLEGLPNHTAFYLSVIYGARGLHYVVHA